MRSFFALLLLAALQSVSAQEAGYKIGFVNTARVLKEAPQARKVEERLKAEFQPREAQLKQKRKEILTMEDQLKTDDSLNANARRKLEREIRLKVSQLKFLEQEFREDQNLRRNEEIRELQRITSMKAAPEPIPTVTATRCCGHGPPRMRTWTSRGSPNFSSKAPSRRARVTTTM